jgi:hypothetical protein
MRRRSGINAPMRSLTLGCLWLLTACGPAQFQQEKLNDGSIKVTCELSMDECVRRAQDLCQNQRYRIIDGTSETRLRDAPPFEKAYHTSRLHFACTDDGGKPLISLDSSAPPPAPAGAKSAAPRACAPGETRVCVGAAACNGGQACLADGSGFGPCDCGPVPAPVSTPITEPAAPAGASAPATPAPPTP